MVALVSTTNEQASGAWRAESRGIYLGAPPVPRRLLGPCVALQFREARLVRGEQFGLLGRFALEQRRGVQRRLEPLLQIPLGRDVSCVRDRAPFLGCRGVSELTLFRRMAS